MPTDPRTLLLVDDNAELRDLLTKQLARHYHVIPASTGREAWAHVQENPPDVVLSDVEMPTMDGAALCTRIKQDVKGDVPVILVTEHPNASGVQSCGADAIVEKPFDLQDLRACIQRLLDAASDLVDVSASSELLQTVLAIIDRRVGDPEFAVRDLAAAVELSRRHLTRRLNESIGLPPATLIRHRRIERAQALLRSNPNTIASVATAVGFQSPSHFSQVFRMHIGCSPSTYMQEHTP